MIKKERFARAVKEQMVDEVADLLVAHPNFVVTSYMGSSVSELEQVRRELKPTSSEYIVVKNSVLKVSLANNKLDSVSPLVDGGVGISFSGGDIVSACKVLVNFSKTHEKFKIKGAMVDGRLMTGDEVKRLASLPSRDQLLAQILGGIKSPITGFVMTLSGVLRKFVYAVDAIKKSKESTATSA